MIIPINSDEFMTTIPTVNTKSVQLNVLVLNIMTLVLVLEYAAHYGLGDLTYDINKKVCYNNKDIQNVHGELQDLDRDAIAFLFI